MTDRPRYSAQHTVEPAHAIASLLERADALARAGRPAVIGITGPVGAGKSHLARALSACILATDDYLPDYDATPEHLRDLPESSDLTRLARDLRTLAAGSVASIPTWSFAVHRRIGERPVDPAPVIVCEGLHALHALVRPALDLMVFVEAPPALRWRRVEHRERLGQRGWTVDYARHFFETVAEPTFDRYAPEYRAAADIIVRNDQHDPAAGRGAP